MRVLVCGDRRWDNVARVRQVLRQLSAAEGWEEVTIVHGGAKGADSIAGDVAREFGWNVEVFPADWKRFGLAAGPKRNQQMIDSEPHLVVAFHNDLSESKGTVDTIKRANRRRIPAQVFGEEAP